MFYQSKFNKETSEIQKSSSKLLAEISEKYGLSQCLYSCFLNLNFIFRNRSQICRNDIDHVVF